MTGVVGLWMVSLTAVTTLRGPAMLERGEGSHVVLWLNVSTLHLDNEGDGRVLMRAFRPSGHTISPLDLLHDGIPCLQERLETPHIIGVKALSRKWNARKLLPWNCLEDLQFLGLKVESVPTYVSLQNFKFNCSEMRTVPTQWGSQTDRSAKSQWVHFQCSTLFVQLFILIFQVFEAPALYFTWGKMISRPWQ